MSEKITVSLRIDPTVWKEARKYAIDHEIYTGELVEGMLIDKMKTTQNKNSKSTHDVETVQTNYLAKNR